MGFLDKLLGREKKPESAPTAPAAEPSAHDHDHEHGEHDHSHDDGGQGEEESPA